MLFEYRYFGATAVEATPTRTGLSFAPDVRRDPTFLRGQLRQKLPFRECISALHSVVVNDLRFRPRDKTAYLEWRSKQDELDVAQVSALKRETKEQLAAAQAELAALRAKRSGRWGPYDKAKRLYFDWLYRKNFDAWVVLDPVITVHPDEVAFECFSQDESSYGRLACSHEVFAQLGDLAYGTTNVDYSYALYDEFQKIRDYKETSLTVEPAGFDVQTGADEAWREVKIDLPDTWVRGFLQVGTAMALPGAVQLRLHPMDVHNLCFALRRRKEEGGPRSLRFLLDPGQPVRVKVEPWDLVIDFPRSPYTGAKKEEVRIWGRRRLLTLERLVPVARHVDVVLLGTGMPSFWMADCGDLTFTLGLSGWTANEWSQNANFDLLAPRGVVDEDTIAAVWDALATRWLATSRDLCHAVGRDVGTVEAALVALAQAGRVMYDLRKGVWRRRELSRDPLDLASIRYANPREEAAARLVLAKGVLVSASDAGEGHVQLRGKVGKESANLVLDADRRLRSGECTCPFHFQNKLRMGPCEHLLALRLAHERRIGTDGAVVPSAGAGAAAGAAAPSAPAAAPGAAAAAYTSWPEPPPFTPAVRRVAGGQPARDRDGVAFVGFLLQQHLVELTGDGLGALGAEVDRILRLERTAQGRAQQLHRVLNRSPHVEEHDIEDEEHLRRLFQDWTE